MAELWQCMVIGQVVGLLVGLWVGLAEAEGRRVIAERGWSRNEADWQATWRP